MIEEIRTILGKYDFNLINKDESKILFKEVIEKGSLQETKE